MHHETTHHIILEKYNLVSRLIEAFENGDRVKGMFERKTGDLRK